MTGGDLHIDQHLVDPVRPVSLVAGKSEWPGNGLAIAIAQRVINTLKQVDQRPIFVCLSGRHAKLNREPVRVTYQVNFR